MVQRRYNIIMINIDLDYNKYTIFNLKFAIKIKPYYKVELK